MTVSRKAFTLVELLVVIAIIGILIGLMFPAIGALREAARRSTCQGRLAGLGMALQKYEAGHGSLPPGSTNPTGPIHNVARGIEMSWTVHLLPYLDDLGTFQHIDLAAGAYAEKNAQVRCLRIPAFLCPSQAQRSGPRHRRRLRRHHLRSRSRQSLLPALRRQDAHPPARLPPAPRDDARGRHLHPRRHEPAHARSQALRLFERAA